jgi:hypothetical protein
VADRGGGAGGDGGEIMKMIEGVEVYYRAQGIAGALYGYISGTRRSF